MTSALLPPSPNWYCSRACDTSQNGVVGFATKNTVFLLNVKVDPPSAEGCLSGHSERVTGVSFCSAVDLKCATSSDDCTVKLWDVNTKTVINEHKVHQFKVTTLHWSPLCKDLVVSGDEKGAIVCWDLARNDSKLFIPEKNQMIFSLSCSPHKSSHVAVGYKNALVLLVDIDNKGSVLHRLRGHEDEIHSICWSPSLGETSLLNQKSNTSSEDNWRESSDTTSPDPNEEEGSLLLTGSKDRTIRVWGVSNGKCLQTLRLPPKGFQRSRDRGDDGGRGNRVWVGLYWLPDEKKSFICSSHSGDIVRWDLSSKPRWEYFGSHEGGGVNTHLRIAFNICRGPSKDTFITTSMDRKIICWNIPTREAEWCLPSLGGFVYCIAASPVDQNRLAIGVGDNMIRVWNSASLGNNFDVTVLWQGIKSKVTTVCWHPTRENCLAYATDDGRIGIYNSIAQTNKPPLLASTFHKKTVYSLSWGPACPGKPDEELVWHLYSCGGGGVILQHDPSNLNADAVNVSKLIRETNSIEHMLPQRTEVCWCPDGRAVAMGNEDGSIDIFRAPDLLLLCTIHVHHKLINCLKWYHQIQTSQSDNEPQAAGQSKSQRYWLASGSNDPHVHVYDLSKVLGPTEPVKLDTSITNSMSCLSGHTLRVTGLSWSPHGNGHLVSASYDGTAQVWDVLKGEPIANFRGHAGRVFTCQWSALQEDLIYTGSEDFTVHRWNIKQCEHKYPPKNKKEAMSMNKSFRYQSGDASSSKFKKNKKSKPKRTQHAKSEESPETQLATEIVAKDTSIDQSENRTVINDTKDVASGKQSGVRSVDDKNFESKPTKVSTEVEAVKVVSEIGEAESNYLEEAAEEAKDPSYSKIRKDRGKKKKAKSLFPISCSLDNRSRGHKQTDCVQLAALKYGGEITRTEEAESTETTHLGFFTDKKAMFDLFKQEGANHDETGYYDQKHILGLWKGSILMEMQEAKQNGTLSDMMVAMASMGGPDVWFEICEAYAQQLEKQEMFVKAANYYVACHQINKAIHVLMNNRYHREAASIATLRLSDQDPLLTEVYSSWATQLEIEGNFEQSAKCYLAINQPLDAIRLLCKKGDSSSLRAGLEVAILSHQETMATTLMARYANECMKAFDWSLAQEVKSQHDLLQAGQLLLQVHETITTSWVADEIILPAWYEEPAWSPWQQRMMTAETQVLDNLGGCSCRVIDGIPSLQAALEWWAKDHKVDLSNKDYLKSLYTWIEKTKPQGTGHNLATKQLLINLANEVILGQLCVYIHDSQQAATHWLEALVLCHNAGQYDMAMGLCTLILPKGRCSLEELKDKDSCPDAKKKPSIVISCLEAYYTLTSLFHLWWGTTTVSSTAEKIGKSGTKSQNKCESETRVLPDKSFDKMEERTDNIVRNDAGQQNDNISASTGLSLVMKLKYISETLLSHPHAKHMQLKHRLARIQHAVQKLVVKHSAQGQVNEGPGSVETCGSNKEIGAGSIETCGSKEGPGLVETCGSNEDTCVGSLGTVACTSDENHDDDVTLRLNTTEDEVACSSTDSILAEEQLPDSLVGLTVALNDALKEIELTQAQIKECAFPDPFSSALTLLYFIKQVAKKNQAENDEEELQNLCKDIAQWGYTHSYDKQKKGLFAKYL